MCSSFVEINCGWIIGFLSFFKYCGDFGAINSDKTSAGAINVSYCLCGLFLGIIFIVKKKKKKKTHPMNLGYWC